MTGCFYVSVLEILSHVASSYQAFQTNMSILGFGLQENQAEGARQREAVVQDEGGEDAAEGHSAEGEDLRAGHPAPRGNQQEYQRRRPHPRTGHFDFFSKEFSAIVLSLRNICWTICIDFGFM